jgi:hypothetical protein
MRKAQLEIMGLAIIVIIIIFGILVSLMFFKPKESTLKTDVTDSTLASNMLSMILRTTLDCKDIDLESLLQDCAEGVSNKEYCGDNDPFDRDPCGKVFKIINESILTKTLDVWKKQYTFRATVLGAPNRQLTEITNTPIVNGKASCGTSSKKYTSIIFKAQPLALKDGRTMEISLDICR